jgi:hypothetical protein
MERQLLGELWDRAGAGPRQLRKPERVMFNIKHKHHGNADVAI